MMMGIPQSPIPQKETSMSASRDFHMGLNKLVNARSVSPNLSNIQDINMGSQNNNVLNMFSKNQMFKKYSSGTEK